MKSEFYFCLSFLVLTFFVSYIGQIIENIFLEHSFQSMEWTPNMTCLTPRGNDKSNRGSEWIIFAPCSNKLHHIICLTTYFICTFVSLHLKLDYLWLMMHWFFLKYSKLSSRTKNLPVNVNVIRQPLQCQFLFMREAGFLTF